MRSVLTTVAELVGMAVLSAGFGLIWLPLGVICAGCCLILLGVLAA